MSVDPDSLQLSFVPRPRASVACYPVGAEVVLVAADTGQAHALNPSAALAWRCFDGEGSLAEIAADIADIAGEPVVTVGEDLLALARTAGRAGLLEGVVSTENPSETRNGAVEVGESVSLPPDGPQIRGDERGTRLLINWSAGCGYCLEILPVLAELAPPLAARGTGIVLLDVGDTASTADLLRDHALEAQIIQVDPGGSPFPGMGTPVAYLLGPRNKVLAPMAYGAPEVVALAQSAAGHEAVNSQDQAAPNSASSAFRYLPVSTGVCGPVSPRGDRRSWRASKAYSIAGYQIGIRADSISAEETLGSVLASHRSSDDPAVPPNFSVVFGERSEGGLRDFNFLIEGNRVVARSRSRRRVVQALAGFLSCLFEPREGLTRVNAQGAVANGQALLLPKSAVSWETRTQASYAKYGLEMVSEPYAHLDLVSGELVVDGPRVDLNETALAQIADGGRYPSEPQIATVGRYPLRGWLMPRKGENIGAPSPAHTIALALGMILAEPTGMISVIPTVAELLSQIDVASVAATRSSDFLDHLSAWLGSWNGSSQPGR